MTFVNVMEAQPGSLMARVSVVRDPRRREGKRYRLPGLLGMMTLAALHGEGSLRGMWLWGRAHWDEINEALDLWATDGPPSYGVLWNVMAGIDTEELNAALCPNAKRAEDGITVDGKVLRGSKRATEPALEVITAAGHRFREVLGQRNVVGQDLVETAIGLLHELPLTDQIVSLDAGLLQRTVVQEIVKKGGPISGRSSATKVRSTTPCGPG